LDPKKDRVTLTSRTGGGDPRCRLWVHTKSCGHTIGSHDLPNTVLYLTDSKHGNFVIYMPPIWGGAYDATRSFSVMPALEDLGIKVR
jgi:hypothetical protein